MRDDKNRKKSLANERYIISNRIKKGRAYDEQHIDTKKKFLIICEGENTEPLYFKSFPVPSNTVVVEGGKNSRNALVDYALQQQKSNNFSDHEIWCVFDYDYDPENPTQANDFNSAIKKATEHGLKVAWSNDAFELWFLLHYDMHHAALTRKELNEKLKKHWSLDEFHKESKTKKFCQEHYERHGGTTSSAQARAIRNARRLHSVFAANENFSSHCPCTTVYLLVEELNKNLKE